MAPTEATTTAAGVASTDAQTTTAAGVTSTDAQTTTAAGVTSTASTDQTSTAAGVTSTASTDAQPSTVTMMATVATDNGATSAGQPGGTTDMQGGETSTMAEPAQTVPRSSAMKQSGSH